MYILIMLICIIAMIYSRKRYSDYLNPVFITAFIWGLFLTIYILLCTTNKNYQRISTQTYIFILSFLVVFTVICTIIMRGVPVKKSIINTDNSSFDFPVSTMNSLLLFAIISNLIFVLILLREGHSNNISTALYNIRNIAAEDASSFVSNIRIPFYLFNFTPVLLCYVFIFKIKAKKPLIAILLVEMFLVSILLATKGRIIRFLILLAILLYRVLDRKKFIIILTVVLIPISFFLLRLLVVSRDFAYFEKKTVSDYIFLYLLSPIPALDKLVTGKLSYSTIGLGPRTFSMFYNVLNRIIGTNPSYYRSPGFVSIPMSNSYASTNVYTLLGSYYMDFGMLGGTVCGILYALLFALPYRLVAKYGNKAFYVFYLLNIPYLIYQTFGDFIMPTFSITLQELLAALIIGYIGKKRIIIKLF